MAKNILKSVVSDFTETEKAMLTELLHIIVSEIVKEVCHE